MKLLDLEGKNGGQELRILVLEEEKVFEWTFQVNNKKWEKNFFVCSRNRVVMRPPSWDPKKKQKSLGSWTNLNLSKLSSSFDTITHSEAQLIKNVHNPVDP
ncbi:hypothetical protein OUZ56_010630 [Daphnia magna]|uniref:Uncharacterized protein n=1 Tax=Daphnia magna TaxID=35525 RepID=A0ABR0AJ30_9CRUS|nr:hypothetical protein OUZ56_010630 [Daphnia magna]